MKKYLPFLLLLASCTVSRPVPGNYQSSDTTYVKSLKLNKNGSFILSVDDFEKQTSFSGSWKYLSNNMILLTYQLKDLSKIVKSKYISGKKEEVEILNDNEIKYNQFVLSKLNLKSLDATASIR
jgi:hypothetical protein